jgi:hypothetical protein
MIFTKKHESDKNILARIPNDVLFAREYEYETPLTPDEATAALKAIESLEHGSWVLSAATLKHRLETEHHSDKSVAFKIILEEDRNSFWSSKMNLLYSEGAISADSLTGLSIIKGRTRFSGQYYLIWALVFAFNIFSWNSELSVLSWFWIGFALLFWLAMYYERNKLADTLDEIIMHAKSERSMAILDDEAIEEDLSESETVLEQQARKQI